MRAYVKKLLLIFTISCVVVCSFTMVDFSKNSIRATNVQQSVTESRVGEDQQVVIDITRGLLEISEEVLQNLSKFIPDSNIPTITQVRNNFAQLIVKLNTQPDIVLSAKQDEQLESLLTTFGPGDSFAALPLLSVKELKPGDIILRCSSALSSQMTELMIWSRYTHSALYIGNGMVIDSTWQYGVKTRSLADLLHESNRVGILRMQGLTPEKANIVISAAQSKESSKYNFDAVKILGVQKLEALTNVSWQSLGNMIALLSRAESLPSSATDNKKYACSELIAFAFKAANITLSQANGFTPGDMTRLSQAGFLSEVGKLPVSTK